MDSDDLVDSAIEAFKMGNTGACEMLCRQILAAHPQHPEGLHILGLVAGQRGDFATATRLIRQAIAARPGKAEFHNNLGIMLQKQRQTRGAIAAHQAAVRLDPGFPNAYNNLGIALCDAGRHDEAEQVFRQATGLDPANPDNISNLATCLYELGLCREATSYLDEHPVSPGTASLHYIHGLLMKNAGNYDAAAAAMHKTLQLDPANARAWLQRVQRHKYTTLDHPDLKALQQLLSGKNLPDEDRVIINFALGKIHDDCGNYNSAFSFYRKANQRMHARLDYHPELYAQKLAAVTSVFSKELIHDLQLDNAQSPHPLFIIGMSRTGKTCLENLLAMHPDVCKGGELYALPGLSVKHLVQQQGIYPACLEKADRSHLQKAALRYRQFIKRISANASYISDTLPSNSLYLGLIAVLFPDARIIYMQREPMDTLMTIYFKFFGEARRYAYRLEDIRERLARDDQLMAHWRRVLPIKILDVAYEELVTNPVATAAAVADHCGLSVTESLRADWSAAGLDERRIGHWRHYREYLEKEQPG